MSRRKLSHYADLKELTNVFEAPLEEKPVWPEVFQNKNPIILELACGGGEYTVGLAKMFPEKNFIGIDIKGGRIWHGATKSHNKKLTNVAFLRSQIEFLADYFKPNEVDEIWITFPDPHEKKPKIKKRLTSPRFVNLYRKILKPKGKIHLKTDHIGLFDYTLERVMQENAELITSIPDIYSQKALDPVLQIQTTYEKKHLSKGKTINYLCFKL